VAPPRPNAGIVLSVKADPPLTSRGCGGVVLRGVVEGLTGEMGSRDMGVLG